MYKNVYKIRPEIKEKSLKIAPLQSFYFMLGFQYRFLVEAMYDLFKPLYQNPLYITNFL